MKHSYSFEVRDGSLLIYLPEKLSPIESLLGDIESCGGDAGPWLNLIAKVLSNKSNFEECTGNSTSLEISDDFTKVINNYALDDMIDECIIETDELKEIIVDWVREFNLLKRDTDCK
ncbi:hypothetical protein JNUCC42_11435 [Brevibacterium sp. JNUCC-42]|nr:hypothetical protein JNUCC42_11435 [Brevibacterium sp. JNUCC-42]